MKTNFLKGAIAGSILSSEEFNEDIVRALSFGYYRCMLDIHKRYDNDLVLLTMSTMMNCYRKYFCPKADVESDILCTTANELNMKEVDELMYHAVAPRHYPSTKKNHEDIIKKLPEGKICDFQWGLYYTWTKYFDMPKAVEVCKKSHNRTFSLLTIGLCCGMIYGINDLNKYFGYDTSTYLKLDFSDYAK